MSHSPSGPHFNRPPSNQPGKNLGPACGTHNFFLAESDQFQSYFAKLADTVVQTRPLIQDIVERLSDPNQRSLALEETTQLLKSLDHYTRDQLAQSEIYLAENTSPLSNSEVQELVDEFALIFDPFSKKSVELIRLLRQEYSSSANTEFNPEQRAEVFRRIYLENELNLIFWDIDISLRVKFLNIRRNLELHGPELLQPEPKAPEDLSPDSNIDLSKHSLERYLVPLDTLKDFHRHLQTYIDLRNSAIYP